MTESTTSQVNAQELRESAQHLTDWWKLDAAIEKVKAIVAIMSGQHNEEPLVSDRTRGENAEASGRVHSQDESVYAAENAHIQSMRVHISDRALSVVAIILASLAIGILIMMVPLIDAKVQAGSAKAEATATTANQHARIALDKVEDFRAKLAEKGVNVTLDGH